MHRNNSSRQNSAYVYVEISIHDSIHCQSYTTISGKFVQRLRLQCIIVLLYVPLLKFHIFEEQLDFRGFQTYSFFFLVCFL